jgi:hypothetical protein
MSPVLSFPDSLLLLPLLLLLTALKGLKVWPDSASPTCGRLEELHQIKRYGFDLE